MEIRDDYNTFHLLAMIVLGISIGIFLCWLVFPEEEPEGYTAYADLSIFKEGKVNIDYINIYCITSKDSSVSRCKADLVFNQRAVGFVNFLKQKQEKPK